MVSIPVCGYILKTLQWFECREHTIIRGRLYLAEFCLVCFVYALYRLADVERRRITALLRSGLHLVSATLSDRSCVYTHFTWSFLSLLPIHVK